MVLSLLKDLNEVAKNLEKPLPIIKKSQFKKGLKKHQHDKKVIGPLNDLITQYLVYNKEPPVGYNAHILTARLKGFRDAHIKGQQVLLLYKIGDNGVELHGLGSHKELNI